MPTDTASPLRAMLADRQTHRRQIEHLPNLFVLELTIREIATATLTSRRDVPDYLIRVLHPLKMTALMAGLPARLAAR